MRLCILIPLLLAGCVVPPASRIGGYHARMLQPDNCGTPDEPMECMPVIHRPPPIVPVYSTPLPPMPTDDESVPAARSIELPNFPLRTHIQMSVINADGTESPIIIVPPPTQNQTEVPKEAEP